MIHVLFISAWLALHNTGSPLSGEAQRSPTAIDPMAAVIQSVLESGRAADIAESPSERISTKQMIPPGLPPLLSFRYYEGREHHRFSNTDLVLDDAGH